MTSPPSAVDHREVTDDAVDRPRDADPVELYGGTLAGVSEGQPGRHSRQDGLAEARPARCPAPRGPSLAGPSSPGAGARATSKPCSSRRASISSATKPAFSGAWRRSGVGGAVRAGRPTEAAGDGPDEVEEQEGHHEDPDDGLALPEQVAQVVRAMKRVSRSMRALTPPRSGGGAAGWRRRRTSAGTATASAALAREPGSTRPKRMSLSCTSADPVRGQLAHRRASSPAWPRRERRSPRA